MPGDYSISFPPVPLEASSALLAVASWLTAWRHQRLCRGVVVSGTRARPSRLASSLWGLSRAGVTGPLDAWLVLLPLSSDGPSRTWTGRMSPRQKKEPQKPPLTSETSKSRNAFTIQTCSRSKTAKRDKSKSTRKSTSNNYLVNWKILWIMVIVLQTKEKGHGCKIHH